MEKEEIKTKTKKYLYKDAGSKVQKILHKPSNLTECGVLTNKHLSQSSCISVTLQSTLKTVSGDVKYHYSYKRNTVTSVIHIPASRLITQILSQHYLNIKFMRPCWSCDLS